MKTRPAQTNSSHKIQHRKRAALYARVSTEEQTRGQYPSCESQIEELRAVCHQRGWTVLEEIKDEGHSAGSLKRPGLSQIRSLVENGETDVVMCTWYDRLSRSRDFYTLDKEFRAASVEFVTVHDPTDTTTAAGRFMESMLVAAKTYEREQTGEKVRAKMRMRAEKGMWNGGFVPYGFTRNGDTNVLEPDPITAPNVVDLFKIYVEQQSDFAVRNWLKARRVLSPGGKQVWAVGTIRDLLCNRRYIAEIEINKENEGLTGLPDQSAYHVIDAPHDAIVPRDLFLQAQAIRREKASHYPNTPGAKARAHQGNGRSYSWARPQRVFLLQGIATCAHCGAAMSPHYVFHKAGGTRRRDSYIHHYVCGDYRRNGAAAGHANRILASKAETWLLDQIGHLVTTPDLIERVIDRARRNTSQDCEPLQADLQQTQQALHRNQQEIDRIVGAVRSSEASQAMIRIFSDEVNRLEQERSRLRSDQRRLIGALRPAATDFDTTTFRKLLMDFTTISSEATPEELQRLIRLLVRRIEWNAEGSHRLDLYTWGATKKSTPEGEVDWFDISRWHGCPGRTRTSDQAVNSRPLYH